MSKFGELQRSRGGNSGGTTESVVFQVKEYHIVDPKNPKGHPDDYIEAYLYRDALGLTAEFDAEGNPTTVVKIGYGKSHEGNAKRPSVLEFQKGKNAAKPMPANSLGKISRAYYDERAGMIKGNWLDRWYPTLNADTDYPLAGFLASVRPQGKFESNGETRYYQNRIVVLPDYAATFEGVAGFKTAAAEAIESLHEAQYPGDHGVIIRVISKSNPEEAADQEVYAGWDREAEAPKSGEVAVAEFLASDFGQKWAEVLDEKDADVFYEVIPTIRVMTPSMSLPAQKVENARANGKDVADTDMYKYDDSTRYRISRGDNFECGFALSDVKIQRKEVGGRWYSVDTMPTKTVPELFRTVEIVTRNLPKDLAEKFEAAAKARTVRDRSPSNDDNEQAPGMTM